MVDSTRGQPRGRSAARPWGGGTSQHGLLLVLTDAWTVWGVTPQAGALAAFEDAIKWGREGREREGFTF